MKGWVNASPSRRPTLWPEGAVTRSRSAGDADHGRDLASHRGINGRADEHFHGIRRVGSRIYDYRRIHAGLHNRAGGGKGPNLRGRNARPHHNLNSVRRTDRVVAELGHLSSRACNRRRDRMGNQDRGDSFLKAFLIVVSLAILFVSALASVPATATATDAHYWDSLLGSPYGCPLLNWADPDCWAHSSGGVGGAGVPTATNPVVVDAAGNFAGQAAISASISVLSITFDAPGEHELDIEDGTLTFTDMTIIDGNAAPVI